MSPFTPDTVPLLRHPFYFLRHGESEANRERIMAGQLDSPLTDEGRRQASAAVGHLAGTTLSSIYVSTLQRAVDTARPIADTLGLELRKNPDLGERNWGVLEGRPLSERVGGPSSEVPGAEPWPQFVRRIWEALAAIDGPAPVLIVAHSGTLRAIREGLAIVSDTKVPNGIPLLFVPPTGSGSGWSYRALRGWG